MTRASSRQTTTAICLLETVLRRLEGKYLGHREGAGEVQNDEVEDNELAEDDREVSLDGNENLDIGVVDGVARSLGDLSTKGSLPGVLKSFHAVRSRKPISAEWKWHRILLTMRAQEVERLRVQGHGTTCKHLAWHFLATFVEMKDKVKKDRNARRSPSLVLVLKTNLDAR